MTRLTPRTFPFNLMANKRKIAIIGNGYVGKAVHAFFRDHFETCVMDVDYCINFAGERVDIIHERGRNEAIDMVNMCDLAIISVPTPMGDDGSCDLLFVKQTLEWLNTPQILIKSTVPPMTTQILADVYPDKNISFSPEYIGEGHYIVPIGKGYPDPLDMKKHEFVIIGGKGDNPQKVGEFFKRVLGAETTYRFVDSTTAELCKYMENAFLATKVTFCNEFANIAEALGVDYDTLREIWLLDGRIGRSHTAVFKDARGFGGKCLPKDVNAIVKKSEAVGYEPKLLKSVLSVNNEIRNEAE
jgi:UDPglucose 6-dehydrogenase